MGQANSDYPNQCCCALMSSESSVRAGALDGVGDLSIQTVRSQIRLQAFGWLCRIQATAVFKGTVHRTKGGLLAEMEYSIHNYVFISG